MTSGFPVEVRSPVAGRRVPLATVPDEVFASAMVGPGAAVDPVRAVGEVVAPVGGKLVKLHPHAFAVLTGEGVGILVHLGLDTVERRGAGFTLLAAEGDQLQVGQPVVRWDPGETEAAGYDPVCPVIALDIPADRLADVEDTGEVTTGQRLFTVTAA